MPQRQHPAVIHVEPTTRCNMRCRMCVKSVIETDTPDGDLPLEAFLRLKPSLANCRKLILAGVGEPLLHPALCDMIAAAREAMPAESVIAMQSNGLLMTPQKAQKLVEAGLDEICISLDSLDDADGESLHGAGRLHAIEEAFKALREASQRAGRPLRLGVEIVIMRENAASLPHMVDYAGVHGASFVIVSHLFPYTREAEACSLFNPNPEQATLYFDKWKALAAQEGLHFEEYYSILWRVNKTDEEKRLVQMVKLMQRDANANGVWMNVKSLFSWDKTDRTALEQALDLARQAAARHGLEISLPPLSALQERRCAFMEDGATFVSRTGHVSPCHFLWRNYRCVMGGEVKHVRALSYGDIQGESLDAIWDKPDYREFRRQALAYEYPYCASCNGGPCSDITATGTPFEEDCIGSKVPCCHCPWPVGQLACLG